MLRNKTLNRKGRYRRRLLISKLNLFPGIAGVSPALVECHFVGVDGLNCDSSELDA
jgi:hypothetical protein